MGVEEASEFPGVGETQTNRGASAETEKGTAEEALQVKYEIEVIAAQFVQKRKKSKLTRWLRPRRPK